VDDLSRRVVSVPAPRHHHDSDPIRVTCHGTGSPPLSVLARVSHVFCGRVPAEVWPMLTRELERGSVSAGDLVLLRVGPGAAELWTELTVDPDTDDGVDHPDREY
jgi:hypothetical protein